MSRRLVIPTKAGPDDLSDIFEGFADENGEPPKDAVFFTWQEVADQNKVDGIEVLGSQWCLDNKVDGLGIATELPPPPPEPPPILSEKVTKADLIVAKGALVDALDTATPPKELDERVAALEKLVAALLDGRRA